MDTDGNLAHVTSHDLRHVAVKERLCNNIISPYQTMIESNHSSLEQTIGYGYPSLRDEAAHLGAVVSKVHQEKWSISPVAEDTVEPIVLPEHKYHSLENQPFTRLIPQYGACCDVSCSPRFEKCFDCNYFTPDEVYLEYIENAITTLEDKIIMLQKKRGSEEAIKFNQERLWNRYS